MPRDLFGSVVDPQPLVGGRQRYALPLSIAVHTALILSAVIVPLLATGALPQVPTVLAFVAPAVAPPVPPPPRVPSTVVPPRSGAASNPALPPLVAPAAIRPEPGVERQDTAAEPGGVIGGVRNGIANGIAGGLPAAPPAPPPASPPPLRVGGQIERPVKTRDVRPVYPPIAQAARVEGVVIIEATIGATGDVVAATVLRSIPLLDAAALDAVRQWTFTPTRLNGVPVPVIMTVTVQFRLQ